MDRRAEARARPSAPVDRRGVTLLEPVERAEEAGGDEVEDRPDLGEAVLDRRAGHGDPSAGRRSFGGGRGPASCPEFSTVQHLVELISRPRLPWPRVGIARSEVVRGEVVRCSASQRVRLPAGGRSLPRVCQVNRSDGPNRSTGPTSG